MARVGASSGSVGGAGGAGAQWPDAAGQPSGTELSMLINGFLASGVLESDDVLARHLVALAAR